MHDFVSGDTNDVEIDDGHTRDTPFFAGALNNIVDFIACGDEEVNEFSRFIEREGALEV